MKRSHSFSFSWVSAFLLVVAFVAWPSPVRSDEATVVASDVAPDEESSGGIPWEAGAEVDAVSRYLWRCLGLSQGPALQPSAFGSLYGASLSAWSSIDFEGSGGGARLAEVDLLLHYEHVLGPVTLDAGFETWFYPQTQDAETTAEANLAIAVALTGGLSAFLKTNVDVIATPGSYFGEGGLRWSATLGDAEQVEVGLLASIGWGSALFNRTNTEVDAWALDTASAGFEVTWSFWGPLFLRPHGLVTVVTDGRIADETGERVLIGLGVAAGVGFGSE